MSLPAKEAKPRVFTRLLQTGEAREQQRIVRFPRAPWAGCGDHAPQPGARRSLGDISTVPCWWRMRAHTASTYRLFPDGSRFGSMGAARGVGALPRAASVPFPGVRADSPPRLRRRGLRRHCREIRFGGVVFHLLGDRCRWPRRDQGPQHARGSRRRSGSPDRSIRPAVEEALVKDEWRPGSIPTSSTPARPTTRSSSLQTASSTLGAAALAGGQHAAVVPGVARRLSKVSILRHAGIASSITASPGTGRSRRRRRRGSPRRHR